MSEHNKQDLNRLRNAIYNEVGVTKQDIRDMVEESIKSLVEKRVKQLLPDEVSVTKMVDAAVIERSLYYWNDDDETFNKSIEEQVAKILAKKIELNVNVKGKK